jgi:RHS repeat-associated protein
VAISDYKLPTATRGIAPFIVDERAVNDYYPYGMLIPERSRSSSEYRYGYNGKENDNEVKGTGNSIDYGARIFDPRVGRFLSLDPKIYLFPSKSPFHYGANNPIRNIDVDGQWFWIANEPNNNPFWFANIYEYDFRGDYANLDVLSIKKFTKEINAIVINKWNNPKSINYAPKIAKLVAEKSIPVILVDQLALYSTKGAINGGISNKDRSKLFISNKAFYNLNIREGVLLHEVIHINGGSEFDAFSGEVAAGYMDVKDLTKRILNEFNSDNIYIRENLPPSISCHYVDNGFGVFTIAKQEELEKKITENGRKVIGTLENNSNNPNPQEEQNEK